MTAAVVCTTSRPTSRLSSASMRSWSCAAASRALAMICSAAAIAFCVSCCLHARGRGAGFLDQLGRLRVGLRHHFLALGLGPGQLGLDLLGIGQALGDLLTPRFQHLEDGSIGEPVQDERTRCRS